MAIPAPSSTTMVTEPAPVGPGGTRQQFIAEVQWAAGAQFTDAGSGKNLSQIIGVTNGLPAESNVVAVLGFHQGDQANPLRVVLVRKSTTRSDLFFYDATGAVVSTATMGGAGAVITFLCQI